MTFFRRLTALAALALCAQLLFVNPSLAQNWNTDTGGLFSKGTGAVAKGYDVVSYVKDGKPTVGSMALKSEYEGGMFYFSTPENKALFDATPKAYVPAYGGYCAYAVSLNKTADIDPHAFAVVDGQLYLNYDADVQKTWDADKETFIKQGNKNWPALNKTKSE